MTTRRNPSRGSDNYNLRYDAKKPRLVSLNKIRKEKELKDELYGETQKREVSKVSLPKFSWEKGDE